MFTYKYESDIVNWILSNYGQVLLCEKSNCREEILAIIVISKYCLKKLSIHGNLVHFSFWQIKFYRLHAFADATRSSGMGVFFNEEEHWEDESGSVIPLHPWWRVILPTPTTIIRATNRIALVELFGSNELHVHVSTLRFCSGFDQPL